jgi:hypothetical protein
MYPSYEYAFTTKVIRIDPRTLAPLGSPTALGDPMSDPQHVRLKFALAGGGVYANGPWSAYAVNAGINGAGAAAGGNATQLVSGIWGGWSDAPTVQVGEGVAVAATQWSSVAGTEGRSNESRAILVGIFLKSHSVAGILGRHAAIRITPRNQGYWLAQYPEKFMHTDVNGGSTPNIDERGHFFMTLGAGPGVDHGRSSDSTLNCTVYSLTKATSFWSDVENPVKDLELLRYDPTDEDVIIHRLISLDENYRDDLAYCWDPQLGVNTYNSNSYISGLLRKAFLPTPLTPSTPSRYLGWSKAVPSSEFDAH